MEQYSMDTLTWVVFSMGLVIVVILSVSLLYFARSRVLLLDIRTANSMVTLQKKLIDEKTKLLEEQKIIETILRHQLDCLQSIISDGHTRAAVVLDDLVRKARSNKLISVPIADLTIEANNLREKAKAKSSQQEEKCRRCVENETN